MVAKAREVKVWFQTHGDLDEGQDMVLLVDGGTPEDAAVIANTAAGIVVMKYGTATVGTKELTAALRDGGRS